MDLLIGISPPAGVLACANLTHAAEVMARLARSLIVRQPDSPQNPLLRKFRKKVSVSSAMIRERDARGLTSCKGCGGPRFRGGRPIHGAFPVRKLALRRGSNRCRKGCPLVHPPSHRFHPIARRPADAGIRGAKLQPIHRECRVAVAVWGIRRKRDHRPKCDRESQKICSKK